MSRALLIEPQSLFAPYFAGVLSASIRNLTVAAHAPKRFLQALDPELVVLDASGGDASPLRTIDRLRTLLPAARIVVFARQCEPLWVGVARAAGADAIVGPSANEADLVAALTA
jgi:DNA-binding NarL/FixJ family response regulator